MPRTQKPRHAARHDQYGTHDEMDRDVRTPRERQQDVARGFNREDEHHGRGSNYGNQTERSARTTSSGSRFEGRDYERENYGGGYRTQHDNGGSAPRGPRKRTGQVGGSGLSGMASERAFGSRNNEQMSEMDYDSAYSRWRTAELRAHDEDYQSWRSERARRYDDEYAQWRRAQQTRVLRRP